MKIWIRRVAVAAAVLLLFGFLALETLRFLGTRAGVETVALPDGSEIQSRSFGNDYADAYRIPLPVRYVSLRELSGASESDREVFRGENEVIFEGGAPGLRYLLSYHVSPGEESSHLTVSTVVFYETFVGPIYFTPVQLGHRRILPFFVSRLARSLAWRSQEGEEHGGMDKTE